MPALLNVFIKDDIITQKSIMRRFTLAKRTKYQPLADFLMELNKEDVTLTFTEIENILGFKLPPSARKHRPNWANNSQEALSWGWMPVGYKSYAIDMKNEITHFRKAGIANANYSKETSIRQTVTRKPKPHDTKGIVITNELIEEAHRQVKATNNYGKEDDLITDCFIRFPKNDDVTIVAMKVGLIDITNSTHVSQHKSKISAVEIAECIVNIKNIDERIKNGDPEVVNEIARSNGNINLFSFATKYCCYHNKNLYGKDDYSILDTVLKESLPKYFGDITSRQIKKWVDSFDYKSYNDYLTKKLDELGITVPYRKRKLDHYIWFYNRKKNED